MIGINDIIQVTYEGAINDNCISIAVSVDEVILSGGDVLIPE